MNINKKANLAEEQRERTRYAGIDMLKFICSFLVVCIHCPFPGKFGAYFVAIARIAVPIFFIITGYFCVDSDNSIRQIKKIILLMIQGNLLFFTWNIIDRVDSVPELFTYFSNTFTLDNIVTFFAFNDSPFSGHLWYLGAILYVLIIMLLADKLKIRNFINLLVPVLLAGDLILGKYSLLILHREVPYIYVRNYLFVGIPYVCIGNLLRQHQIPFSRSALIKGAVLFSITTILERYFLESLGVNAARDHYISTTFLAISVFLIARQSCLAGHLNVLERVMSEIGRKCSAWVYIIHPIFISMFFSRTIAIGTLDIYSYIEPVVIFCISIVFVLAAGLILGHLKRM